MVPGREESASPALPEKRHSFATTHWSVVLATRDSEPDRARQALERLCRTYWYPVYACIRRHGKEHAEAEDLTQEFFEKLLSREAFQHLEPARGRLRSFLGVALRRHLQDVHEREYAQKRVANRKLASLDGMAACERYRCEPVDRWNPEQLFERRWAVALLDKALQRLKTETSVAKHGHLFEELKGLIQGERGGRCYAELGDHRPRFEQRVQPVCSPNCATVTSSPSGEHDADGAPRSRTARRTPPGVAEVELVGSEVAEQAAVNATSQYLSSKC